MTRCARQAHPPALRPAFAPALCLAVSALALLILGGCAGRDAQQPAAVALAVDGPPLALYGEYSGMRFAGSMDRACMAGYGALSFEDEAGVFSCEAALDDLPTEKGRVRGLLRCTGERKLLFSLRNIGPDQGVGIARETEEGDLMVFFYHASAEEAKRRYPSVKDDIERARAER